MNKTTDEITDLVATVVDDDEIRYSIQDDWLELAAPIGSGHCPDHPWESTRPAWAFIEHGQVVGAWGGPKVQCGECGTLAAGWVQVGPVNLADKAPSEIRRIVRDMMDDLTAQQQRAENSVADAIRQRLRGELRAALADLAAGADPEDVATGDEVVPGVWLNEGRWEAWDYAPSDGDFVVVTEEDLA